MLYNNISKMLTKKLTFAFVVLILNSNVICSESEENDQINIAKKLEMLESNLNDNIKEAIESAIQNMANDIVTQQTSEIQAMANKNNNEMKDIIEKTFANKLELQENHLNTKIKETIANDSDIANLANVIQTMSQKLTRLERSQNTVEFQTQLQSHTVAAQQTNNKDNETNSVRRECGEDTSASRLLHVMVPSSVHAQTDVWSMWDKPAKDDLDMYMINVTGCEYMASRGAGFLQSLSDSTARGGTWRRRLALRGLEHAFIRITWGAGQLYEFYIGYPQNTETRVWDGIRHTTLLQRATPGVMSKERYTQFLYLQLEDGVMSFGALGDSTPWCRHDVTVSAGDVVHLQYWTGSYDGVKLLMCE